MSRCQSGLCPILPNKTLEMVTEMTMRRMSEIVRQQNPVALAPDTTVQEACRRMRERHVGAVLVIESDRRLIGIFTGRDAICRVLAERRDPAVTRIAEVMTRDPATMAPSRTAIEALRLMHERGFRHIPVVEAGKLLGVVSRGDFRGLEQDRLDEETLLWEQI
jgi:CBS domain-containing protein